MSIYSAAITYYYISRFRPCDDCKEEGELHILEPGKEIEFTSCSYRDDETVESDMEADYPGSIRLDEYDDILRFEKQRIAEQKGKAE